MLTQCQCFEHPCQYIDKLNDVEIQLLIEILSRERLDSYFNQTHSERDALKLYELNLTLSQLAFELIQSLEVAMRNRISTELQTHFKREDWFKARCFTQKLTADNRADLRRVRERLTAEKKSVNHGRVTAALSFGFWTHLHANRCTDTLWTPAIHKAWPEKSKRKTIHKSLIKTNFLRNRIAHHEPIFSSKWTARFADVSALLEMLSPDKYRWCKHRVEPTIDAILENIEETKLSVD